MEKILQPSNFFPETAFLICKRRKSQPKISPLICEQRCQRIRGCQEYFDYVQPAMFERYEKREIKEKEKGEEKRFKGGRHEPISR
jgi:hypothetical protein